MASSNQEKRIVSLVVLGMVAVGLLDTRWGWATEQAPFVGTWELNFDESDDPEEKIEAALASAKKDRGGRRSRGPDPEDPDASRRRVQGMERILKSLSVAAETLTIDLQGNELQIAAEGAGRVRIFYFDGKKHVRQTPQGVTLETLASWNGKQIAIEQEAKGTKITETYELGSDPDVMVVVFRLKNKQLKEPIVIRSVYDALRER